MQVNEKQKQISKLLWDFESLREEHILKICNCLESDINYLISKKVIKKDKDTKIIKYNNKEINSRNVIAFDVVMHYLDRNAKVKKAKYLIISETKNYIKKIINTNRPYCICTYPPLEIVDMINWNYKKDNLIKIKSD